MTEPPVRPEPRIIGILGGTGAQGRGLARRLAAAGYEVVLGSRDAARAQAVAVELGVAGVRGAGNADAADEADLVIAAVPYQGHGDLLASLRGQLAGKIVVDCVNPIGFDSRGPYPVKVDAGSAAEEAQQILPDATVVAAFHHVSAVVLDDASLPDIDCDVAVLGEDRAAVEVVRRLADAIPGARGVYAGRLRNAGQVEALTANLIAVNRRYKTHAGVRFTGLPTAAAVSTALDAVAS